MRFVEKSFSDNLPRFVALPKLVTEAWIVTSFDK